MGSGITLHAQTYPQPTPYYKIDPLVEKFQGKKIKRVLVNYNKNEVVVFTGHAATNMSRQEAAAIGIIPPIPAIQPFTIDADIYYGIVNPVTVNNIDTSTERILSDDGGVYFNTDAGQWYAEVFIPDTAVFYKINTHTMDTIGVCIKPVLQLPDSETIHPLVSFGDMNNKLVTTDLLQQQKSIKIPKGYTLLKATIYFAGFSNVVYIRSISDTDLSPLQDLMDSCKEGSSIITDNVLLRSPQGRLLHIKVPSLKVGNLSRPFDYNSLQFQFGSISFPRAECGRFKRQKKFYISNGGKFISAIVYFGGAGFPAVKYVPLLAKSPALFYDLLQQCVPGSVVSFDNIKIKTPKDGERYIDGVAYALF